MKDIFLSRSQVRNCDVVAVEKYGVPSIVLMENAAIGAAAVAAEMLNANAGSIVSIIAAAGNNAGDGFALARHLTNSNYSVTIFMIAPLEKLSHDAAINYNICKNMNMPICHITDFKLSDYLELLKSKLSNSDLIVDAIFGTGLAGPPRQPAADIIDLINTIKKTVLALDIPTGLDCDSGTPLSDSTIIAARTVTFAASKTGFQLSSANKFTGPVTVAHIGIKTELLT